MVNITHVTSVATQGSQRGDYVSTYYLNYTVNSVTWVTYEERGKTKVRSPFVAMLLHTTGHNLGG